MELYVEIKGAKGREGIKDGLFCDGGGGASWMDDGEGGAGRGSISLLDDGGSTLEEGGALEGMGDAEELSEAADAGEGG
jgi:hypothetical protein